MQITRIRLSFYAMMRWPVTDIFPYLTRPELLCASEKSSGKFPPKPYTNNTEGRALCHGIAPLVCG
jgi:hypothetical protein